jgi:hypothetical protein
MYFSQIAPAANEIKVYLTGGFRTVGAMVDALKTVDGIGLGRPVCGEPDLAKKMLAGEASGAIKLAFDEEQLHGSVALAGAQIKQVGKDHQPIDGSDAEALEGYNKDVEVWMKRMQEDAESWRNEIAGYAPITSLPAKPYGSNTNVVVA